jgi:signal transduction histidine kinase
MVRRTARKTGYSSAELAVRLHDAAAGLAVGIGLLKVEAEATHIARLQQTDQALAILVDVQANLSQFSRATADLGPRWSLPSNLPLALKREAARLGVRVDLTVIGETNWLSPNHYELVWLTSREGLKNVRRHSGTAVCRIRLDVSGCPFVLRIRDWGGGIEPRPRLGDGIGHLRQMAEGMGCALNIGSQPGLGAELALVGPPCARQRASKIAEAAAAASGDAGNP